MSLLCVIMVVILLWEMEAFNQLAKIPLHYVALGSLDHPSLVADFLCFLDCSSRAENFPYIA